MTASKDFLYACQEFLRAERLGDVVIHFGDFHPEDAVDVLSAR